MSQIPGKIFRWFSQIPGRLVSSFLQIPGTFLADGDNPNEIALDRRVAPRKFNRTTGKTNWGTAPRPARTRAAVEALRLVFARHLQFRVVCHN